jgi:hypothetical protein
MTRQRHQLHVGYILRFVIYVSALVSGVDFMGRWGLIQPTVFTDWRPVFMTDLNSDGSPDILWQSQSTGAVCCWLMNGTTCSDWGYLASGVPAGWQVIGSL